MLGDGDISIALVSGILAIGMFLLLRIFLAMVILSDLGDRDTLFLWWYSW